MPKPRYAQVSLEATPYYHCVSRCVRRAYLCGVDSFSGQDYEHRRQWIEDKLYELTDVFALGLCAYAVMSNHYHVVLYVDKTEAENWSGREVIRRWHTLFSGTYISQKALRGDTLLEAEQYLLDETIEKWRLRLMDISWFMRVLNESIARAANAEDSCTGRFWEGRFKSQALLDEAALAACLAYVDLNPIRACMAKTPEHSNHTSVKKRIEKAKQASIPNHSQQQAKGLFPFAGIPERPMPKGLPFQTHRLPGTGGLVARIIREDKRGAMDDCPPPILSD